ncbi:MAG: SDR family NAD(P)-dependent oxidoreductase [Rhodobacter sp.]|nr:SDR family NAD(P)-dependent oxidoreductase [Rhodobacter sp.]
MKIDTNTVAVVTGGASGLGAATAKSLAEAGAQVTIFDMNAKLGAAHAASIGGCFEAVDVSDPNSVAAGLQAVTARHGALHILVNCAGIGPAAKTVSRGAAHDPGVFQKTIAINLIGSFNCAAQAAAIMTENDPKTGDGERGVIVNTASVAAYEGQIGQVAYAASKGGIVGMTLPMARDLAQHGIRVVSIAPGLFLTPLLESLPKEVQDSLGAQAPFPARLGDPTEFAAMVLEIARNPMMNGSVVRLDAALRMTPR